MPSLTSSLSRLHPSGEFGQKDNKFTSLLISVRADLTHLRFVFNSRYSLPAAMIWEVALGVGGTAAVVVALVVLVAMCTVSIR